MLANAFETDPNTFTVVLKMRFQKFFTDQIMSLMLDYVRLAGMEIKEIIESTPNEFQPKGVFILLLSGLSSSREWSSTTNNFRFDTLRKLQTRSAYLNFCHNMNSVSTEAALACILTGKSFQNMKDQEVIDNLCQQNGTNLISKMQAQNFRISTFIGKEGFDWISKIGNNSNRNDLIASRKDDLIIATISGGQSNQRTVARGTAHSVDDLLKMDQDILDAMTQDFSSTINKNIPTFSIGILFGVDRIAHELGESGYIRALQNVDSLLGSTSMEKILSDERVLSVICSDHGMSFGLGIGDHRRSYDDLEVKYSPLFFYNRNFTSRALWMASATTTYSLVDIAPTILRLIIPI